MSTQIVTLAGGQVVTTSLAIAEGVGNPHASVIRLVRENITDLEDFGLVRFQIRPRTPNQHGGGDTEYAVLNEQQATLLLTYMRNNVVVREFKKRLVRAFFEGGNLLFERIAALANATPIHALCDAWGIPSNAVKARTGGEHPMTLREVGALAEIHGMKLLDVMTL